MAYFTNVDKTRAYTESEQAAVDGYISAQQAAGNTNGNVYEWSIVTQNEESVSSLVRMWGTIESANGLKDLNASFNPPILVLVY